MKKFICLFLLLCAPCSAAAALQDAPKTSLPYQTIAELCASPRRPHPINDDTVANKHYFDLRLAGKLDEAEAYKKKVFADALVAAQKQCVEEQQKKAVDAIAWLTPLLDKKLEDFPKRYTSRGTDVKSDRNQESIGSTIRDLLSYVDNPDARPLALKAIKQWQPLSTFVVIDKASGSDTRVDEIYRDPEAAALLIPTLVAMLEAGETTPEQAKAVFGVAEPNLHRRAAWKLSFFNKPELDAKVYAMAMRYKKRLLDSSLPLAQKRDIRNIYISLITHIDRTTTADPKLINPDEFVEALYTVDPFIPPHSGIDASFVLPRMDSPAPPSPDVLLRLFSLGFFSHDDVVKAMVYLPDTALARHFAAMAIAQASRYPAAGDLFSAWGYNIWEWEPSYSLEKVTPERRLKAKAANVVSPENAAARQKAILEGTDGFATAKAIRSYALVYAHYPETYPWLRDLYFQWKKEGKNERGRAEILAALNHADTIPAAEYVRVLQDKKSGRILQFAAAGALYTLKDQPSETDLIKLYQQFKGNPADDLLLANIAIAMRRLPDSPAREKVLAEIMNNPQLPYTRRQVRIIRYGHDMEEYFHAGKDKTDPEVRAFQFAQNLPFALDLYAMYKKSGDELRLPLVMGRLVNAVALEKEYSKETLQAIGEVVTELQKQAENSRMPNVAYTAKLLLDNLADYKAVLEAYPSLEQWKGWFNKKAEFR